MNSRLRRLVAPAALAFGVLASDGLTAPAAPGAPVEVSAVKFSNLRAPGGSPGNWYEAAVALNVRPAHGAPAQMVSRVKVILLLAFDLPGTLGGERRIEHYRAEAECVALEPGRADVRFYLPAEIVKRDQLHGDPRQWGVEILVDGRPMPAARAAYPGNLATADARKAFQKRVATAAAANDGVLVPQYLSPFSAEYPRATPSFVRRETR
ncbi:MAG: hypothetical protein ACKODK_19870 [Opitutaceae bacterium]